MKRHPIFRLSLIILEISILLTIFMPSAAAAEKSSEIFADSKSANSAETAPQAGTLTDSLDGEKTAEQDDIPAALSPFPDIAVGDWYYDDIAALAEKKIIHGYPDGSFRPDENITYAEFTKILINAIDVQNPEKYLSNMIYKYFSTHWASPYINIAYELGIITSDDIIDGFEPDLPIPRSKMTKMMVLALDIQPSNIENPFLDLIETPDIYAATAYNVYLLRGYPAENGFRIFDGEANATRGEAATIAVRVIKYKENPYEYIKGEILENTKTNPLVNESELIDLFHILNREFITDFTFTTPIPYEIWSEYYRLANILHLEHFYTSYLHCSYLPSKNEYTLTLEYGDNEEKLREYAAATNEKAKEIISAIITEDMNDIVKIISIHDYIVLNCKYDYENYVAGTLPFESHLAYGVLVNGSAICQGYSAAFNLLCKAAGIPSIVVTGTTPTTPDQHAWNAVLIDNTPYFVDTTHDDPVPDKSGQVSYKYFLLSAEEMAAHGYKWDPLHTNIKYFY